MQDCEVAGSQEPNGCIPFRAPTEDGALRIEDAAERAFARVAAHVAAVCAAAGWSVGVQLGHGLPVTAVLKGSPADEAGILEGNIILKANGSRTPTLDDFDDSKDAVPPGEELRLTVFRGGSLVEVKVVRPQA
jgi:S1-C subfamily serine protease